MKWIQALRHKLPKHKYAINAKLLGDSAECAWTNLGYWDEATSSYPQACVQLAEYLAQYVQLKTSDRVLDLGCGQGASLKYWLNHYQIDDLEAVELQQECVRQVQKNLPQLAIHQHSFLNLNEIPFEKLFDVVLCIDAAYHSDLNLFLNSIQPILNSKGRIGFHYLMLSEKWQNLSKFEQEKYRLLLKSADVHLDHLYSQMQIEWIMQQFQFENIQIEDLSKSVFLGFSNYISHQKFSSENASLLDAFKIKMTAKLCNKLHGDGLVRYIQITARNAR